MHVRFLAVGLAAGTRRPGFRPATRRPGTAAAPVAGDRRTRIVPCLSRSSSWSRRRGPINNS